MKINKTHLVLLILVVGPILLFNSHNNGKGYINNTDVTNTATKGVTNTATNIANANDSYNQPSKSTSSIPLTQLMPKVVCEECHLSGKSSVPQALNVVPHLNGGKYCLYCHTNLHTNHPINKDVTCEKCHGTKNETIPISGSDIVCINCHSYPNPLNKSYGNLITIHRDRNVSCINCHAETCTKCHKEVKITDTWEKRQTHFNTILGALPQSQSS